MAQCARIGISVDEFCEKHRLDEHDLLVLALCHHALLPPVLRLGGSLRVLELPEASSAPYRELPVTVGHRSGPADDVVSAAEFVHRFGLSKDALLELALRSDLPTAVRVEGRIVFAAKAVEHWVLRKRAEFLLEVTS